jgi:hypothetical protein
MRYILTVVFCLLICVLGLPSINHAQQNSQEPSKVYYGGELGMGFGDIFRIRIVPFVAYRVAPKASVGARFGYEYLNWKDFDQSTHNFGGGVFGRYRFIKQIYGHGEVGFFDYDSPTLSGESNRTTVPFILLGGGYIQQITPNTSAFIQVLFDVLQSDKSPYNNWEPFVSIGVGVGF